MGIIEFSLKKKIENIIRKKNDKELFFISKNFFFLTFNFKFIKSNSTYYLDCLYFRMKSCNCLEEYGAKKSNI